MYPLITNATFPFTLSLFKTGPHELNGSVGTSLTPSNEFCFN